MILHHPRRTAVVGVAAALCIVGAVSAGVAVGASNTGTPPPPQKHPITSSVPGISPATGALPVQRNASVAFANKTFGWMVLDPGNGGPGAVVRSTDGGSSWQSSFSTSDDLWGLQFVNPNDGWVLGATSLSATADGGATWTAASEPASPLSMVTFTTAQNGWGVTADNSLVETSDGGQTWTVVQTPVKVEGACLSNRSLGWIVGGTSIYVSSDGGANWAIAHESPVKARGPLANRIVCYGTVAWAQIVLGAGAGQESVLELMTTAGSEADSWRVAGGAGPQTTSFPQVGISGLFATPVVHDGAVTLIALCTVQCGTGSMHLSSVQNSLAIGGFSRLTDVTIKDAVTVPSFTYATGQGWMVARTGATGNYNDLVFRITAGSTAWQQVASVPIPAP